MTVDRIPPFDPQIDEFRRRILSILVDERYAQFSAIAFHVALIQAANITKKSISDQNRIKELELGRIVEEGGIEHDGK